MLTNLFGDGLELGVELGRVKVETRKGEWSEMPRSNRSLGSARVRQAELWRGCVQEGREVKILSIEEADESIWL